MSASGEWGGEDQKEKKGEQARVDDTIVRIPDESPVSRSRSYETQVLRVKDLPPNKKDVWYEA
jgi:hypothetical protein